VVDCPKCESVMEPVRYGGGDRVVNRCTHCAGIWMKPNDMTRLKNTYKADMIDHGSARAGRQFNKIEDIHCPQCGSDLEKVSDNDQRHIWYESCPDGHGMYFDAGELSDYNNETLSDIFKSWLRGKR